MSFITAVDNPSSEEEGTLNDTVVQLNPATIERLRDQRILREQESQVDLPAFKAGEEKIGILNVEERTLFIESCTIEQTLWDWSKEISARSAEKVADFIRSKDNMDEIAQEMEKHMLFQDDGEAEEYYAEVYRKNYIDALMWFSVRERLECFGATLSIRYGFAVARSGYKYRKTGGE